MNNALYRKRNTIKADGNVHVNDTWNRRVVITYFHVKGSNCTLVKLI